MADPTTTEADDEREDTYDPSELEATLERQQGLGMGARDLQRQRDPTRTVEDRTGHPAADDDQADS